MRCSAIDFDVIQRSCGLPVPGGHDVHADADRAGDGRRHLLRHAARDDAAVDVQAAVGARRRLREPDALAAAGAGDLLVLLPRALHRRLDHRRRQADPGRRVLLGGDHLHHVRGGVLLRDHARRHPVDPARPGVGRLRARPQLLADHGQDRAAAGVPQHAAGAAHADHHPVPGHLARLRASRPPTSSAPPPKVANRDYRLVEMYTFVAVVYFVISFGLAAREAAAAKIAIVR